MRKLRLPTAADLLLAKTNENIMERAVIEQKWLEMYPDFKMFGPQQMMLIMLMTYLQSDMFKHSRKIGYVTEPLIFSMGRRMGASTFIKVLRLAYPDLVRVVAINKDIKEIFGFDYSSQSKEKPPFKDKLVIFDGNLVWHDRRFIDHVRGSMPVGYISFGA